MLPNKNNKPPKGYPMHNFLFSFGDKKVLTVMAVSAEYGKALQNIGVTPYYIGVGPVQAAMNTTYILSQLQSANNLPDFVFNIGSAGSNVLNQAEVYQVKSISYRDIDVTPFGFTKGETPFSDHPIVLTPDLHIPDIASASLSTGAKVITIDGATGEAFSDLLEDMVDMESYAVLTVAKKFNIPFLGLRGISDGHSTIEGKMDWTAYLDVIDQKLANIYKNLLINPDVLQKTVA
jgi:adenosylhomocysteine nucleosidase